jgi:phenylacetic acid degradation operon negative regulatory protein
MGVAAAGLVGLAIAAPNMPVVLRKLGLTLSRYDAGNIARTRKRLEKEGLIFYKGPVAQLTEKGKRKLYLLQAKETLSKRPKRWDGRWRLMIFDIPEYRKTIRDKVRQTLRSCGFYQLQKSVWMYPYPCEELIILLKSDLKIGKDMRYMIVDELEMDAPIRKHFKLPARQ